MFPLVPRANTTRHHLVMAGAALSIAVTWGWITAGSTPPAGQRARQEAVGQVMAEEAGRLVSQTGRVVVVTFDAAESPILKAQMAGFQRQLQRAPGLRLDSVVTLTTKDPGRYGPGRGLSAGRLLRIIAEHPGANAVVSFVGIAGLDEAQVQQFGSTHVKLVVETRLRPSLAHLLNWHVVQVAIVPRIALPAPRFRKSRTPGEWFERHFQIIHAPPAQTGANDAASAAR